MKIESEEGYIAVHGDFKVLSSAVYNGGFVSAKTILNLNVSSDFKVNAFELFDSFLDEQGLEKDGVVGMMTAVAMNNARIIEKEDVTAIITAGISKRSKSTVNIILLINNNLSQSAMANAVIVATEAKTAAFFDLDVHDEKGDLFTGDSTDSVVVACYGYGEGKGEGRKEEIFAGKATKLGKVIYEVVREGVMEALFRHDKLKADRPILTRLEERGIHLEDMVSTALELYVPVEGEVGKEELKKRLEETIKKECSDVNVALLLAAAFRMDEEEIRKGRAGEAGEEDAACIVADELIGIDIAEYIGGKKALFNFFYYDTRKPGILSRLDVFMDDAIGGLIAGCMSKMLG
ncbi:MAG: alpha-ribazole phosphatase CobZ [Candidatus Syntrophoarchaeum sp.]|nr:alpha-ribazole phosphatase CobZ [Candidatus Syntrophoarchaeum sp.]